MHKLKVPDQFSGFCVQREQTVREKIVSLAIGSIEVVHRSAGRYIDEPALLVQTHLSPAVRTASGLPGVFRPGLVAKFTGMRDGVKNPGHFSGSHVVSTDVTRRGSVLFPGRGAQNNQIAVNLSRRCRLNLNDGARIAAEACLQVHRPVGAEGSNQFAGARINGFKTVAESNQKSLLRPVFALPEIDAAMHLHQRYILGVVSPELPAAGGVERDDRSLLRQDVHRLAYDQRAELVRTLASGPVTPSHTQKIG